MHYAMAHEWGGHDQYCINYWTVVMCVGGDDGNATESFCSSVLHEFLYPVLPWMMYIVFLFVLTL